MTHYRQVIIDLSVDDETDESELEKLKDIVTTTVLENSDPNKVQIVGAKVN